MSVLRTIHFSKYNSRKTELYVWNYKFPVSTENYKRKKGAILRTDEEKSV